jgi:Tfp pilus assembly protein PilO
MFGDITNCPADDTRFRLRAIFREGAQLVDSIINEIQGEAVRLTTIEARLDSIESRLDLVLQCLPRPLDEFSDRLVALEHAGESLQEVRPIDELKPEFCQELDVVHLRVDNILTRMGTHVPS